MRLWGKILTTTKDYYIAEGIIDTTYRENTSATAEKIGTGCNKLTFWVTNNGKFLIKYWKVGLNYLKSLPNK